MIDYRGIDIDANRANEDEPWRLDRLKRVVDIYTAVKTTFGITGAYLIGLYDHKGNLTVRTRDRYKTYGIIDFAWGHLCECLILYSNAEDTSFSNFEDVSVTCWESMIKHYVSEKGLKTPDVMSEIFGIKDKTGSWFEKKYNDLCLCSVVDECKRQDLEHKLMMARVNDGPRPALPAPIHGFAKAKDL